MTGGRGVDVVLDSLVGEFVDASLQLLPRGGRFIEMGKADIREPGRVAAEYPGVSYRAFDLLEAGAERIQEMLGEVMGSSSGVCCIICRSRGLMCVVLRRRSGCCGSPGISVRSFWRSRPPAPEGTILITGGTGGLGALLARHLWSRCAPVVVDQSQRAKGTGRKELKASLEELGAKVKVAACDVAQGAQLKRVIAQILKRIPSAW